jgi:hypothetical protein
MKQPGVPLHHAGGDFLIVEGGYNDDTRTMTLLVEPENPEFQHPEGTERVSWCEQGEWNTLAKWDVGMITLQDEAYEDQRDLISDIFERHLEERTQTPDVAWALQGSGGFAATLEDILPMGLAVKIFTTEERPFELGGENGVVAITNLPQFLTQLSKDGYAGAMWEERMPIFFCLDDEDDLQFLRVGKTDQGAMQMDILDPSGDWGPYEGAEEIIFLENRDACDRRMVAAVGQQPLLDWPQDDRLWSVGPADGVPGKITADEDDVTYGVLFSSQDWAQDWTEEVDPSWVTFPVLDVQSFLGHDELAGCGGLLNPGGHRVRTGVLWRDGERVVIDTFSGFWALDDGDFEPLD